MDLLLATTSANQAKPPCTRHEGQRTPSPGPGPTDSGDEGQRSPASDVRATDSTSATESRPFDALLGACVQDSSTPAKKAPQQERPLPVLGAGGPAPRSEETQVEGAERDIACLTGRQRAAGELRPGLLGAEAARGPEKQASQEVESGSPQRDGASSGRQGRVAESEGFRAGTIRDESAEGAFLSKESVSGRGEVQEAGSRSLLSRMEAVKSMDQTGEHQGGDSKPAGHAGQGESAASLVGKDGASWKQEVQTELPTRPAPPPVTSNQATPAHAAQVGSGGTFRILGDAVHMRIQDEELGPMRWHIHLSGGRITAEAIVETSRVQELLQNHQNVLEAKLNAMGVEVEEFDVSVDEGSQRFTAFSDADGSRHTRRSTEGTPLDAGWEAAASRLQRHMDRGLDLYV